MKRKIVVFSFFAGAGILDLAFESNGFDIVFVNEYNSQFLKSYQFARKATQLQSPIHGYDSSNAEKLAKRRRKRKLIGWIEAHREEGDLIGFIGGPPCPDFSVAGKNAGSNGQNGRLTKTYFDLVCRCKPDFFLFENVKGLVKTEKHKKFYNEMKRKVQANGYIITDSILNALDFGVPQYRERICMVGVAKDILSASQIVDKTTLAFDWEKYKCYDSQEILKSLWPDTQEFCVDSQRDFIYPVPEDLTVEHWFRRNDVNHHANGADIFTVKAGKAKMQTICEGDTKGKSYKRLHRWRYSPTAAYGHNEVHLHPYKERRLSVAEAMAIQSLPETFCLPSDVPLSSKFKMIGNGVPFLMAQAIAKTIDEFLNEM